VPDSAAGQPIPNGTQLHGCKHFLSDSPSSDLWGASFHPPEALEDYHKLQPEACLGLWVHWEIAKAMVLAVLALELLPGA
jgi:hypothetical protein